MFCRHTLGNIAVDHVPIFWRGPDNIAPILGTAFVVKITGHDHIPRITNKPGHPEISKSIKIQHVIVHGKDLIIIEIFIKLIDAAIKMSIPFTPWHKGIIEFLHDLGIINR
jgi:hypothetical protein